MLDDWHLEHFKVWKGIKLSAVSHQWETWRTSSEMVPFFSKKVKENSRGEVKSSDRLTKTT